MARSADCRRCIHFIRVEKLDNAAKKWALEWIEKHRPGEQLLGWCTAYGRPVTYYTGTCPRFAPKDAQPKPMKSILDYLKR